MWNILERVNLWSLWTKKEVFLVGSSLVLTSFWEQSLQLTVFLMWVLSFLSSLIDNSSFLSLLSDISNIHLHNHRPELNRDIYSLVAMLMQLYPSCFSALMSTALSLRKHDYADDTALLKQDPEIWSGVINCYEIAARSMCLQAYCTVWKLKSKHQRWTYSVLLRSEIRFRFYSFFSSIIFVFILC